MRNVFSNKINYSIIVLSIILIGCSFYKASNTSFTHDESFTFNHYVQMNFMDIVSYKNPSANNHIVNTLLMKLFGYLFGTSEISLRFPNILAHIAYIFFSILLLKKMNGRLILPLFIILNFNPYLLDFFSLARGYGLAICFMMGSIYFLIEFFEHSQKKYYLASIILSCFAVLCNLTLIYFFFALIAIYNLSSPLKNYLNRKPITFNVVRFLSGNKANILITALLSIILYEPIRKLIKFNQLYFGGDQGFWESTIHSLVGSSLYGNHYIAYTKGIIDLLIITVIAVSVSFLAFLLIKRDKQSILQNNTLFAISMFLLLISSLSIINHHLFGTKYHIQRTALFYIPLFSLNVCLLFKICLSEFKKKIYFAYISAYSIAAIVILHNLNTIDFNYYIDWKYDMNTKKMLSVLETDVKKNNASISLGINWIFEPSINYYRKSLGLEWIEEVNHKGIRKTNDYFFVLKQDVDSLDGYEIELIKHYQSNNTYLFKHK